MRRRKVANAVDPMHTPRPRKLNSSGVFRSGQTGQTVNLMAYAFGGSNPSAPNHHKSLFWKELEAFCK